MEEARREFVEDTPAPARPQVPVGAAAHPKPTAVLRAPVVLKNPFAASAAMPKAAASAKPAVVAAPLVPLPVAERKRKTQGSVASMFKSVGGGGGVASIGGSLETLVFPPRCKFPHASS